MKVTTIFKYHFTFEYWTLRVLPNGETDYVKQDDRTGLFIPGGTSYVTCDEPMGIPMQIRNVRDRNGRAMFEENGSPIPLYVVTSEPQLDPFSNVVAFKHSLRRNLPREYSELIAFALADG